MLELLSKIIEIQCREKCNTNHEIDGFCQNISEMLSHLNSDINIFMQSYVGVGYSGYSDRTHVTLGDDVNQKESSRNNQTGASPTKVHQ